jgi:putative peptidoglycan lipid II flippase
MRRRLRILRRRREAMLLDLGALVLEMHRHGRFLPDSLQRRAAEAVGTDAELRSLSRALDAGDGSPDLVAAGVAGNCDRCGALHTVGSTFCSQCGNELAGGAVLPRKAVLGSDPELAGGAPVPRRTVAAAPAAAATATAGGSDSPAETSEATQVLEAEPEPAAEEPAEPSAGDGAPPPPAPPPAARRARATRVRQRLDEPARPSQSLPTGLLAGIAAGILVIVVGILVLSSGGGGDDEPDRAAQAPAPGEPEPPPPDEAPSPTPDEAPAATALEPVEGVTASDYDPSGDDEEHPEETALAVDGDAATSWPTEEYDTGSLQKDGVGLALEPAEPVPARGLDLVTTTPGFDITIYGAESELPTAIDAGWTEVASEEEVERKGRIDLDTAGRDFSHYLIWITAIPADEGKVEIAEARLLR